MAIKPIVAAPEELKNVKLGEMKSGMIKALKKGVNESSAENPKMIFINTDADTAEGKGAAVVFGDFKGPFKKYCKTQVKTMPTGLYGNAYVEGNEEGGFTLFIQPLGGKMKSKPTQIIKAVKKILPPAKVKIEFLTGAEGAEDAEELASADSDSAEQTVADPSVATPAPELGAAVGLVKKLSAVLGGLQAAKSDRAALKELFKKVKGLMDELNPSVEMLSGEEQRKILSSKPVQMAQQIIAKFGAGKAEEAAPSSEPERADLSKEAKELEAAQKELAAIYAELGVEYKEQKVEAPKA